MLYEFVNIFIVKHFIEEIMELKTYLNDIGIPLAVFARKIGVSIPTIHNAIKGERDIRLSLAIAIEDLTDHKVTCRDLCKKKTQKKILVPQYRKKEKEKEKHTKKYT